MVAQVVGASLVLVWVQIPEFQVLKHSNQSLASWAVSVLAMWS